MADDLRQRYRPAGSVPWRILYSNVVLRAVSSEKVLFIGSSPIVFETAKHIQTKPELGMSVLGYLDEDCVTLKLSPSGREPAGLHPGSDARGSGETPGPHRGGHARTARPPAGQRIIGVSVCRNPD